MRHCNSVFNASDIWFLIDKENLIKRRLYIANCPICNKSMALYSYFESGNYFEKYYYSNGAVKIKERLKKDISFTMLDFKIGKRVPFGFKYGKNKEIRKNGKIIAIKQYSCDFWGNEVLVKQINNDLSK